MVSFQGKLGLRIRSINFCFGIWQNIYVSVYYMSQIIKFVCFWVNIKIDKNWIRTVISPKIKENLKGALSGLRQLLAAESPLKLMKNAFYFTSKALFVLKIFKFLSWLLGHVAKRLDKKGKVNFKFYKVTNWLTSNWNTHIAQYLKK